MAKRIVDEEMRFSIIINGDQGQKELYNLEKSTRELTQRNKELRQEKVRLFAQGKKESEAYKKVTAEIKANNAVLAMNKGRMAELQKQIGLTGLTMAQLQKKASQLRLQLRNMVPGSAEYKKFNADLKSVNAQLTKLRLNGRASQSSLSGIANGFNKYAALGASVIATVTGVVFSVQKLIDFNGKLSDSMSDVQKTTGLTLKEVEELSKGFGVLQTRTNRISLLKIAEEGGRIGIAKEEIADFVAIMDKAVVALSDSFPGGAEETASKLGKLKLLFKETKDQGVDEAYNAIGSAINELGANGVATEVNIANFATRLGSLPDALKPTIADALGLGAAFEESGIKAEIAGRAYSILLNQSAEESEKFAKVMGITNDEVQRMINDDPLEFMIKFAKGLKGMSATDTAKTLQFLGVSADGANKVLGALSNNTDRFASILNLSNQAMSEGTSLIAEYNIKNNNFAATLDKLRKYFNGIFVNGPIVNGIKAVVTGLADLFDIVDDVDEAFEKETKQVYKNAKANRELADSGSALLSEYEDLVEDGVDPSTKAKLRLEEITISLKSKFGESVVEIDKETGALKLNTAAVRQQIKLKRLAADEEAATLISRLKGVQEEQKRLELKKPELERQTAAALRLRDKAMAKFSEERAAGERPDIRKVDEIDIALKKRSELFRLNKDIEEQEVRRKDLIEKLNELNFNESDVASFFEDPAVPTDDGSGGEKGGKGGNTGKPFIIPTGGTDAMKKNRNNLLDFQRETQDAQLALMSEGIQKELEQQRINNQRKIEDLQSSKVTKGDDVTKINAEINKQIQLQEEQNQFKVGEIIERGIQEQFTDYVEGFERERAMRQVSNNERLAALANDEQAQEQLKKQFDEEELSREEAHLEKLLSRLNQIKDSGYFSGINLELLTPDQVAVFNELADDLILKLSEVGLSKSALTGSQEDGLNATEGTFGTADLFGFTPEQWQTTFDSLDTVNEKIEAGLVIVGAMSNAYGKFSDLAQKKNKAEFENFAKLQDKRRDTVERNLESGLINQRQHDEAVRAIEEETARKKAELDYKQAQNDKVQGIANAIINTSVAIMQGYAQLGPIGGTIAAVLMGTLGALQINAIRQTPLPAKGFESGFYGNYPVRREQDGKVFNASFGGDASSQLVDKPKYFLAGEGGKNFPEMIIDGKSFKQFNPNFKDALYREIARVKGFESGYYQNQSTNTPSFDSESSTEYSMAMMGLIAENTEVLKDLRENGVEAYLRRNLQNAKQLREDIKEYENLRNKNKR